nr:vegetative cell wall protein gp1-like [Tanacetum cinerariifolium]
MPFEILTGNKLCVTNIKLVDHNTWVLVPRPPNVNTVCSMWLFKHKYNADGFFNRKADSSLLIFHKGPDTTYLLLYVDDIILTASSTSLLQRIISLLHAEFAMTDLLTWFSKCQNTLSRSSPEAEYREVANAGAETSWIRNLLRELHTPLLKRPWSTVIMETFGYAVPTELHFAKQRGVGSRTAIPDDILAPVLKVWFLKSVNGMVLFLLKES